MKLDNINELSISREPKEIRKIGKDELVENALKNSAPQKAVRYEKTFVEYAGDAKVTAFDLYKAYLNYLAQAIEQN